MTAYDIIIAPFMPWKLQLHGSGANSIEYSPVLKLQSLRMALVLSYHLGFRSTLNYKQVPWIHVVNALASEKLKPLVVVCADVFDIDAIRTSVAFVPKQLIKPVREARSWQQKKGIRRRSDGILKPNE
jgi:hypothetical protein